MSSGNQSAPRYRNGRLLCNAKNNTCGAFAMKGKTKCYNDGGATPQGPTHGAYKSGIYSNHLPSALKDRFVEAMGDPALTEYRQDIALLQTRLCQLLETGESQPLWSAASQAFKNLQSALTSGDTGAIGAALSGLHNLVNRGMADSLRWQEVYDVAECLTKVKEREHKRLVAMSQMITAEQFIGFIGFIVDVAKRTIKDQDQFRAFAAELDKSWNRDAQQGIDAGH